MNIVAFYKSFLHGQLRYMLLYLRLIFDLPNSPINFVNAFTTWSLFCQVANGFHDLAPVIVRDTQINMISTITYQPVLQLRAQPIETSIHAFQGFFSKESFHWYVMHQNMDSLPISPKAQWSLEFEPKKIFAVFGTSIQISWGKADDNCICFGQDFVDFAGERPWCITQIELVQPWHNATALQLQCN